ncbi:glucose-6-phosphate isomerase [Legionella fairfieldensis]|uniref:glucose-6-phosphate isomerase n=1 Tax=Legionella fairfieldensis TaxID=45064 RepID=UPI00049124C3|nr:glucose-6-phosphate isomerase [Legionella fairfieldensis]
MKHLTELGSWIALENHSHYLRLATMSELKKNSTSREARLKLATEHVSIDFTNQRLNETTIDLLIGLANERGLKDKINALLQGDKVNRSENRAALHTALRIFDNTTSIRIDGQDIVPDVLETRETMRKIATKIREGKWLGFSGESITDIVNIGIGGSDFGPRFCINALSDFVTPELGFHFISDADPFAFENAVKTLRPETTLFIISSKSFTTRETLYNTKKALNWLNNDRHRDKHFIAVTANIKKAQASGFSNVLPIWNWVGGRYSLCSAINLITCIAIGYPRFTELLMGAHSMDQHFYNTHFHENLPVMLALVGLWNINFLHIPSLLLLVYAKQLEQFVPYIQQLDMESNGKSIDNLGRSVNYATSPIIWGGPGNQAQHSYYQLLCQGTHKVAADFISTQEFNGSLLSSFCEDKIRVLNQGLNPPGNPNGYIPGGMPINHIQITSCSPACFGSLIALYEHKVYVQSVLWNINSFDQPGVESAKRLKQILDTQNA